MKNYTRKKKRFSKKRDTIFIGGGIHNKCVFLNMMGEEGLGNQLFSYASGLLAKKITGLPLCIIPVKNNPHSKIDYTYLFDGTVIDETKMKKRILSAKSIVKNFHQVGVAGRWTNADIDYNKNTDTQKNVKLPNLLYHNYKGIHTVIPNVKDSLVKNEFHKKKYMDLKEKYKIDSSKSAFMHVRRGDYNSRNWSLQISYYTDGLDKLRENLNIERLYIVSNNIEWCKQHNSNWKTHFGKDIEYLDKMDELETLYIMMCCEAGALISNSTFSAWGTILGADMNSNSTIIYPDPWIYRDPKNPFNFPDRWIPITNKNI